MALISLETKETILSDLEDILSAEAFEKFKNAFCGLRVYLPSVRNLTENSPISKVLGYEDAQKLCEEYVPYSTGILLEIPLGDFSLKQRTNNKIKQELLRGTPVSEIVKKLGIHRRTLFNHKAKMKRQGILK